MLVHCIFCIVATQFIIHSKNVKIRNFLLFALLSSPPSGKAKEGVGGTPQCGEVNLGHVGPSFLSNYAFAEGGVGVDKEASRNEGRIEH